jgi:hypothetical protein
MTPTGDLVDLIACLDELGANDRRKIHAYAVNLLGARKTGRGVAATAFACACGAATDTPLAEGWRMRGGVWVCSMHKDRN